MRIIERVDEAWRRISFLLMPGCCVLCGAASDLPQDLCGPCRADLPWNRSCCARCALPLPIAAPRCGRCLASPPAFDGAHCAFRYAWPLDGLVTRFKFGADLAAGRMLAALLAEDLARRRSGATLPAVDLVLPVPLHEERLRERGFNQALELAVPLARALGIPLAARAMQRLRPTPKQSGLTALRRRRNVRGAFHVLADVGGRHIALVDDVITTAATAQECTRALILAGAASVQAWAIARAPLPGSRARDVG